MALKTVIPFPIFAPNPTTTTTTTSTELRFSRWNNANAEEFNQRRRTQQQIEDDLRRYRRFNSALNITDAHTPHSPPNTPYKSTGTPSSPSLSSIPGKKSKYSKPNPNPNHHPAFRKVAKRSHLPHREPERTEGIGETEVKIRGGDPGGVGGLSYVVPGAPFEFMYSYTEAPRGTRPVGLREPAVSPFGPGTMGRPWTGRKPLPGTKKLLPEFDSFRPPPAGKKGVKTVQKPGPYLPGSGPRYVMSREEVLGEELEPEEVTELVEGCKKSKRQLNMGRDGLTHNMLDNIHAHWKRRRVCKIKCKGVCTVDMDNVCQQLEEKTGGKIIYRRGGVLYLFRGRNYNYRTRPRFPLMLWKPISPMYPRLVKQVPEGLTMEEATDMRRRGRELAPICKLGKNGVYIKLVDNVREAFEVCDLVRINCQGLNPSDYRKIGAKLKDLVPCVLISFELEHILMWRGKDWKSSLMLPEDSSKIYQMSESDRDAFLGPDSSDTLFSDDEQDSASCSSDLENQSGELPNMNDILTKDSDMGIKGVEDTHWMKDDRSLEVNGVSPSQNNYVRSDLVLNCDNRIDNHIKPTAYSSPREFTTDVSRGDEEPTPTELQCDSVSHPIGIDDSKCVLIESSGSSEANTELRGMAENTPKSSSVVTSPCTEGVLFLLRQAIDSGSALTLDGSSIDADLVYERSVALAKLAPPGPVFVHRPRKVAIQKPESEEKVRTEAEKAVLEHVHEKKTNSTKPKGRKSSRTQKAKDIKDEFLDVVPQGSLKIDELAKLLA